MTGFARFCKRFIASMMDSNGMNLVEHPTAFSFPSLRGRGSKGGGINFLRTVQELLEHKGVKTTIVYTHVLIRGPSAVRSPMDAL
jgi:site-specific recombinase XerC